MPSKLQTTLKPSPFLVRTARFIAYAISRILWRIEFHDTDNIPDKSTGGFIVASNHPTYFDPFWISLPIKADLRFLAWDQAFEFPIIGSLIRKLGAMPTSLEKGGSFKSLKDSLSILRQGSCLVIFPEGERQLEDGHFLEFKTGVAKLALKTKVPILPVTVVGGNHIWPRNKKLPGPGKVDIYFHPPIQVPALFDKEDEEKLLFELTNQLRETILQSIPKL